MLVVVPAIPDLIYFIYKIRYILQDTSEIQVLNVYIRIYLDCSIDSGFPITYAQGTLDNNTIKFYWPKVGHCCFTWNMEAVQCGGLDITMDMSLGRFVKR